VLRLSGRTLRRRRICIFTVIARAFVARDVAVPTRAPAMTYAGALGATVRGAFGMAKSTDRRFGNDLEV
jgi:hypothetical protein